MARRTAQPTATRPEPADDGRASRGRAADGPGSSANAGRPLGSAAAFGGGDRKLKIMLVSTEVAPYAKVGGLADVAAALPRALAAAGHDVRVIMPCYPMVEHHPRFSSRTSIPDLRVSMNRTGAETEIGDVLEAALSPEVGLYLVRHPSYFRPAVTSAAIYPQPVDAYLFFSQAVFAAARVWSGKGWSPDVLHCNDWHTGLIPALLSQQYRPSGDFSTTGSLFTIHNLAFQGLFGEEVLDAVGLPRSLYTPAGLEFYGKVNFLKAGLLYSDLVNTVSEGYAREIQLAEYGAGLEGVLRKLAESGRLRGILNGIDTDEYDPETDPRIAVPFSAHDVSGKEVDRTELRQEVGLDRQSHSPLVGMVGRLFAQKGLDLLTPLLPRLIELGFQFVILGSGDSTYERALREVQQRYPARFALRLGFDETLGQRIFAGSDFFLMPSRFEPCGLGQLMSQRYGSVPIVRKTGGLADTVIDHPLEGATGFVFEGYAPETLLECMKRALAVYNQPEEWRRLVVSALNADFSWTRSAMEYVRAYTDAIPGARSALKTPDRDRASRRLAVT